jgi:hypothetical protein
VQAAPKSESERANLTKRRHGTANRHAVIDSTRSSAVVYAGLKARLGPFQRAEVLGNVDRVRLQLGQVDHLQRPAVGCGQHHRGSDSGIVSLSPTFGNDTPPIAGSEAGKAVLRHRCDQVVADIALMIKKFSCQYSTHQVESVRWTRGAAAVAIKARNRICTARLQLGTENIGFTVHSPSVSKRAA